MADESPRAATNFHGPTNIYGPVVAGDLIQPPRPIPVAQQIPAPPGDFVGRATERASLAGALAAAATTTAGTALIHGLGGTGKTALAYAVAADLRPRFARQVRLDLAGAGSTPLPIERVLQTACLTLGHDPQAPFPDTLSALQGLYSSLLGTTPTLILADDAAGTAQVTPLLPPPGHALLVTSRQRFRLPGAATVDLSGLPPEEAETLLRTICASLGAEEAALVTQRCAYLPLALRISAGLLAATPQPVAAYLETLAAARLAALADPADPTASIEAAFAVSYAALDPPTQITLAQLSIFPAPFARAAALAVPDPPATDAILDELYRRHLLEWDAATDRFALHDLVREFARAHLPIADDALALRHAQYYARVASEVNTLYQTKDRMLDGLKLFDQERMQIDTGWTWARTHAGSPVADALLLAYSDDTIGISDLRYHARTERIPQLEAWRDAARRQDDKGAESAALGNLGLAYAVLGETPRAIAYHEQDLAIRRAIGNRQGECHALGNLGVAHKNLGELDKSIDYQEQHLALAREIGDQRSEGHALGNLGVAYQILGELDKAIGYYEQHLALAREIGDQRGEVPTLGNLGTAYENRGEVATAIGYYEQHLALAREIGDRRGEGKALGNLGNAYHSWGEVQRAIDYHGQQLEIMRTVGDRQSEGTALGNLGNAYAALGDSDQAISYYEQYLTIARDIGDPHGEAISSWNLGLLLLIRGEQERGTALMQVRVDYLRALGHPNAEADAAYLAQVRAGEG